MPRTHEATWNRKPGEDVVPGYAAWAHLGSGPRCETWLCWCARRGLPVVVKLPRIVMKEHPRALAAVRREIAALTGLDHAGIVRMIEARPDHTLPYFVTEFVEGRNLAELLDEEGPLGPEEAGLLVLQVAAAVRYLHTRGMAHLDLKPANVALRDGRPVLLDLGAAQALGTPPPEGPRGTHRYMSPEQERGTTIDVRMDVYGLAAVLHEAVSGRAPRPRRHRLRGYEGLAEELLELSWRWRAPSPDHRPPDMSAAMRELDELLPESIGRPWPPELRELALSGPPSLAVAV